MASVIATQIKQKTPNQLETVVQALATKFGFDAAEALLGRWPYPDDWP